MNDDTLPPVPPEPERPDDDADDPRTEEPHTLDQPTLDQPLPLAGDEALPTPPTLPPFDPLHPDDPNPTTPAPAGPFTPWYPPRLPSEIPGYELLQILGRGGLGVVYRARHQELGIEVALKVFNAGDWARSQREVQRRVLGRLLRLRHPHVASTYGLGEVAGHPYLVMQFIDGRPLNRLPGPFSFRDTAALLEQVARGVGCLHEQGILHRDLKPGNILVDSAGTARVADFGLAMCVAGYHGDYWPEDGHLAGTPHFMAPEQVRGETSRFGPPVDVWALGVTLYWMLTGSLLFPNVDNIAERFQAILYAPLPSPRGLRPDVPAALEAICARCLERDPARRYPHARALADDLVCYLNGTPLPSPRRRPWWAFWRSE